MFLSSNHKPIIWPNSYYSTFRKRVLKYSILCTQIIGIVTKLREGEGYSIPTLSNVDHKLNIMTYRTFHYFQFYIYRLKIYQCFQVTYYDFFEIMV